MTFISRRDLLKRAGAIGAAAAVSADGGRDVHAGGPERPDEGLELHDHATMAAPREPLENLTAAEADLLEAIVARLIPSDANVAKST
jgi:hypothetical protein